MKAWFQWEYGSFGVEALGKWVCIRAPWCLPYFSERYGYVSVFRLGLGWRILARPYEDADK